MKRQLELAIEERDDLMVSLSHKFYLFFDTVESKNELYSCPHSWISVLMLICVEETCRTSRIE